MGDARQPRPDRPADKGAGTTKKAPWIPPKVTELPRLTDLTLQTGSPIPGDGDTRGGGGTVF